MHAAMKGIIAIASACALCPARRLFGWRRFFGSRTSRLRSAPLSVMQSPTPSANSRPIWRRELSRGGSPPIRIDDDSKRCFRTSWRGRLRRALPCGSGDARLTDGSEAFDVRAPCRRLDSDPVLIPAERESQSAGGACLEGRQIERFAAGSANDRGRRIRRGACGDGPLRVSGGVTGGPVTLAATAPSTTTATAPANRRRPRPRQRRTGSPEKGGCRSWPGGGSGLLRRIFIVVLRIQASMGNQGFADAVSLRDSMRMVESCDQALSEGGHVRCSDAHSQAQHNDENP